MPERTCTKRGKRKDAGVKKWKTNPSWLGQTGRDVGKTSHCCRLQVSKITVVVDHGCNPCATFNINSIKLIGLRVQRVKHYLMTQQSAYSCTPSPVD